MNNFKLHKKGSIKDSKFVIVVNFEVILKITGKRKYISCVELLLKAGKC